MKTLSNALHPLCLDRDAGRAELAGFVYLASEVLRTKDGRVAVYLTEAAQPEHVYKFVGPALVSTRPGNGTLYAACFGDDGHGRWISLTPSWPVLHPWEAAPASGRELSRPHERARRAGASTIAGLFSVRARQSGGSLLLCDRPGEARAWREALADVGSLSFVWQGPALELPVCAYSAGSDAAPGGALAAA